MPVNLSSQKIIKDWIDYNNHMNVSYYLLIFDKYGADILNDVFKMGEHSAKTTGKSTMIVESHITKNLKLMIKSKSIYCILIMIRKDFSIKWRWFIRRKNI